jgi:hypothetical protein
MRWNTGIRTLASATAFVVSGLYHESVGKTLHRPRRTNFSKEWQATVIAVGAVTVMVGLESKGSFFG